MKVLVFYHGFFVLGQPPGLVPAAANIIREQMDALKSSGLLDAASEFIVGINGGDESCEIANLIIPPKSKLVMHGLKCRNENRTIQLIEEWVKNVEGEAYVCYWHCKGGSFPAGDELRTRWRRRMDHHVIYEWRQCVAALDSGAEACGCHWLTPEAYPGLVGNPYFAGTYWWAKASYLKTLPSITESPAVKIHGMDAIESRYEAESFIGHGPRRPRVIDFCPGWPS